MPIVPPPAIPPYDEVETVLNFARVIANDAGISIAGNLLSDSQPYVLPMLNLAWRKLQDRLGNNSIESFPQEIILTGIPAQNAISFADPAVQAYINYSNYWDGIAGYSTIFLPGDMQIPLRLWERVTGMNASFIPMVQAKDGLSSSVKTSYWGEWEWRDDAIYLKGANQALDLRIRYKRTLADMTSTASYIPIIKCAVALAYLTVEIFAAGRGSVVLPVFSQGRDDAIKQLINQTTRKLWSNTISY